ncbi:unnamed protein product, partial [Prorocentrum cordatum]
AGAVPHPPEDSRLGPGAAAASARRAAAATCRAGAGGLLGLAACGEYVGHARCLPEALRHAGLWNATSGAAELAEDALLGLFLVDGDAVLGLRMRSGPPPGVENATAAAGTAAQAGARGGVWVDADSTVSWYKFAFDREVILLRPKVFETHSFSMYNVTVSERCLVPSPLLGEAFRLFGGYDTIVINELAYTFRSRGYLKRADPLGGGDIESWAWSEEQVEDDGGPAESRSVAAALARKLALVGKASLAFLLRVRHHRLLHPHRRQRLRGHHVPGGHGRPRAGNRSWPRAARGADAQLPVDRGARGGAAAGWAPHVAAVPGAPRLPAPAVVRLPVLQLGWGAWKFILYRKSSPDGFEERVFSFCCALELFNLIFVRTASSARVFPRLAWACMVYFHFYMPRLYPFHWMALATCATTMTYVMVYCVNNFEEPALRGDPFDHSTPTAVHPRALYVPQLSPSWALEAAPLWTMFYPPEPPSSFPPEAMRYISEAFLRSVAAACAAWSGSSLCGPPGTPHPFHGIGPLLLLDALLERALWFAGVAPSLSSDVLLVHVLEAPGHDCPVLDRRFPPRPAELLRPLLVPEPRCSPIHGELVARGCVHQARHGFERPGWFEPAGGDQAPRPYDYYGAYAEGAWRLGDPGQPDVPSNEQHRYLDLVESNLTFGWPGTDPVVKEECRAAREGVAIFDQSYFGKFFVRGPEADAAMQYLCGADLEGKAVGSVTYTPLCNARGGVEADLTVTRLDGVGHGGSLWYIAAGGNTVTKDLEWIKRVFDERGFNAVVEDRSESMAMISVQGPHSRALLQPLVTSGHSLGDDGLAFSACKEIEIAGHRVMCLRLTFVGELGFELHVPSENAVAVYRAVREAGDLYSQTLGVPVRDAGYRAIDSLSAEKNFRHWHADLCNVDTPMEAGIGFT